MAYERKRPALDACPVEEVLAVVGGKWKARILYQVAQTPQTFAELRRGLPGITQQVLSEQLRGLESDGIVSRRRTELGKTGFSRYTLTAEGQSLMPVLEAVSQWGIGRLARRGIDWAPTSLAS